MFFLGFWFRSNGVVYCWRDRTFYVTQCAIKQHNYHNDNCDSRVDRTLFMIWFKLFLYTLSGFSVMTRVLKIGKKRVYISMPIYVRLDV